MDPRKCTSSVRVPSKFSIKWAEKKPVRIEEKASFSSNNSESEVDVDLREIYFLLLHFLSSGPCKRAFSHLSDELLEHQLLPRRYHSWFSRDGGDKGISFPLTYAELAERYPHIEKDHLVKLLKQLMIATTSSSGHGKVGRPSPNAADVPTLLGIGSFSLLDRNKNVENKEVKPPPAYLHWPHMQAGQIRALALREIGGGFTKHHRAPSTRSACFAIAKPSTLLEKMQNIKKLRGHRNAVYCAIFDRSGRYVITGSDDRLVKVWSMETALCLASCRGHEGDITDLAVSSNNAVVASASNDFVIRVWRLPDGMPVSVLQGHTGAVTAIAFSPRPNAVYQLLSSSDDGTCRIWEVRFSQLKPKIYQPKPLDALTAKSNITPNSGPLSTSGSQNHQILCCAFNADGAVFVTGSSDTYARVWNALKSNTDELPMHEMDILAGHEDDVNYVQFSGCPVASKPPLSDSLKEESFPKFKNSWFCHDNIVTCSRDGSAIIWIPRSRRSHGKVGRWTRAYHLKVPPPPLPPQPARGGPRQRFLPTPRGVNMIVWSLDNRFVLAAIMDCRICVWNAVDGSLVHSLTGHTASSYVLDVHPFNPRIAMSAGYDGKTIVWDIWEGTPIRTYAMGDFKLVDGKFSADGTSIVVSDDAGQIYLINTGEGELQKNAKYDQFFLGDYRPVVRDTSGGVLDQETQLPSHQRNIQDPLCDSTMMPYPEPYQTAYQRRRLGALGIEWKPSMTKFAIGPDFNLGIDYLMPPLPDLERIIEPLPDFVVDAAFWDPVNEVLSEDSDSEYNVAEENSSEGEKERSIPSSTSDDSEFSAEDGNKDGLRRSRRKKHKLDSVATSGRRVKKRNLDASAGTSSTSYKNKKPKTGHRVSKRKSLKPSTSRPKRLAACNARNMLSQISGTSSEIEEDEEEEFESERDSSDGDLVILEDSDCEGSDRGIVRQNCERKEDPSSNELFLEETPIPSQLSESQNDLNKRKFVLKFSLRDTKPKCDDGELDSVPSSSAPQKRILKISVGPPSKPAIESNNKEPMKDLNENENGDVEQPVNSSCGGVKSPTCRNSRSEDVLQVASPSLNGKQSGANDFEEDSNVDVKNERDSLNHVLESSLPQEVELKCEEGPSMNKVGHSKNLGEKQNAPRTLPRIRIKKARILTDPVNPPKLKFVSSSKEPNPEDIVPLESPPKIEDSHLFSEVAGTSSDYPGTVTDAMRRTRSLSIKASSRKENVVNHNFRVKTGKNQTEGTSRNVEEPSRRSRFARTRGQNNNYDIGSSSQRAVSLPVGKLSWLTMSEHEDCYRYIPQLGDEVVYLIQGHQAFSEVSGSRECPPRLLKENLNAVEFCNVEALDYTCGRGSGESCCKIRLKFIDPSSKVFGKSFTLTLPELKDFSDFVVERSLYDAAINRKWTTRDTCYVWWKNQCEEGGEWWCGRVMSTQAKSPEFPDSPWMRFQVRYKGPSGETEEHNPWELSDEPYQIAWDRPRIDPQARDKLLHYLSKLEDQEFNIIQQMNQAVQKTEYSNRYPAPLYPELIKARLKNEYYRSLESVKNDIRVMFSNYEKYFTRKEPAEEIDYISSWLTKRLSRL